MTSVPPLPSLASLSDALPDAEGWTAEEIAAIKSTKKLLLDAGVQPSKISPMELTLCVMNCKLRPEKAAEKYKNWIASLEVFGISSMEDVWGGVGAKACIQTDWSPTLIDEFSSYAGAGRDAQGRCIMWIRGGRKCKPENEREHVIAGQMYFIAVHSGFKEMREGITFVIDTTDDNMMQRQGNENKLQKTYQAFPLRPQALFIAGAGFVKRTIINAFIRLASVFSSNKILSRLKFVEIEEIKRNLPAESWPEYVGGPSSTPLLQWVKQRISGFPEPPSLDD